MDSRNAARVRGRERGDRFDGRSDQSRSAKFFYNGAYRGEIADPAFTVPFSAFG